MLYQICAILVPAQNLMEESHPCRLTALWWWVEETAFSMICVWVSCTMYCGLYCLLAPVQMQNLIVCIPLYCHDGLAPVCCPEIWEHAWCKFGMCDDGRAVLGPYQPPQDRGQHLNIPPVCLVNIMSTLCVCVTTRSEERDLALNSWPLLHMYQTSSYIIIQVGEKYMENCPQLKQQSKYCAFLFHFWHWVFLI